MNHAPAIPYIPNQIILFGEPSRLDAVIRLAAEPEPDQGPTPEEPARRTGPFRLLARTQFTLKPRRGAARGIAAAPPQINEVRLYHIEADEPQWLDKLIHHGKSQPGVFIERNYLIRAIPWTGAGSPWTGAGSPWTGAGSPWTGAGSPWTGAGSPWAVGGSPWMVGDAAWLEMPNQGGQFIRERAEGFFARQWAFGTNGVNAHALLTHRSPTREDGEGVIVGVFDASPFPVILSRVTVEMPPAPLTLTLKHPIPGGAPGGCGGIAANHGFFVAGLIHALAPAAEIQLIRVLDDAAQGNLFTLVAAIGEFIHALPEDARAVINLSLGFAGSDVEGEVDWDGPDLLRHLLRQAVEQDVVIVAAAGNDNDTTEAETPATFPARWAFVLGVAASDARKARACFSNQGDVLAPGGSGLKHCQPPAGRCHDGDCPYALISLNVGSYTGYSYGIGTSYAAPLAAGLAARLQATLDDWAEEDALKEPGARSQAVMERIKAIAASNDGVITIAP